MENALTLAASPATAPAPDPRYLAARDARLAYEDAVTSDGVSAAAWDALADQMHAAVDGLKAAGALAGLIESLRARAVDAQERALYAARMLEVARSHRPIDMSSIVAA